MRRTLDSVAAQTVKPALWIVVDDGSTDETPKILEEYSRKLPWLRVVRKSNRGKRAVGPGVIEAEEQSFVEKLVTPLKLSQKPFCIGFPG